MHIEYSEWPEWLQRENEQFLGVLPPDWVTTPDWEPPTPDVYAYHAYDALCEEAYSIHAALRVFRAALVTPKPERDATLAALNTLLVMFRASHWPAVRGVLAGYLREASWWPWVGRHARGT